LHNQVNRARNGGQRPANRDSHFAVFPIHQPHDL
jgi:hypothetical protein